MNGKLSNVLSNLIIAEFSSIDEGITELSNRTGINANQLLAFLRGEAIPQRYEAAKLAKSLSVLREDSKASFGFLQLCDQHLAEFAATQAADVQTIEPAEPKQPDVSEMDASRQLNDEIERLRKQVEEYKAALEAKEREMQERQEQENLLRTLEQRASLGVEQGWLPPVVYKDMFSELNQAKFSAVCEEKQIDPLVEMYAISYLLNTFEKFGKSTALFSSTEPEPIEEEQSEDKKIEEQALLNFKLYKAGGNFHSLESQE